MYFHTNSSFQLVMFINNCKFQLCYFVLIVWYIQGRSQTFNQGGQKFKEKKSRNSKLAYLSVVWMKGVLSDMIQNSSLIIQNWWDPRKTICLDSIILFWSLCFGDSITQKSEWWSLKKKTDFSCFQIWSSMIQWHFRK